jgi:glucose-6-phosphate isomerase
MNRTLATIGKKLSRTLCIVISKSGGTRETRNGMLVAQAAYEKAGLKFGQHAVAVTMFGSEMDKYTIANQWLERFPMWDWIGGRTSELSAVGLLPRALHGIDVDELLAVTRNVDSETRTKNVKVNPSSQFEPAFYVSGNGKGTKNMVVLPYKDRLELFSKYLQQLVMESLGKEELDSDGKIVNQGICVLGNKGSTDQNSHIQQLRDGLNDFFVTFIEVQKYQLGEPVFTEVDATSGDFLEGFFLGTRSALAEKNRESIAITVNDASVFTIRLLIALFERAVGYYASLVKINAYHQPGVEAGKKAAGNVLTIQREIISYLKQNLNQKFSVFQISNAIGQAGEVETVFKIIEHLAANPCEK